MTLRFCSLQQPVLKETPVGTEAEPYDATKSGPLCPQMGLKTETISGLVEQVVDDLIQGVLDVSIQGRDSTQTAKAKVGRAD